MNNTADWALCAFDSPPVSGPYERIGIDPQLIKRGSQLQLTGFGCTSAGGTGGNDGVYRIGDATVTTVPTSTSFRIVTNGPAALCFGDSGGGGFVFLDAARRRRVLVSVNSQVGTDSEGRMTNTSFLSSLAVKPAQDFIRDWSASHGVLVCGIHPPATACRS